MSTLSELVIDRMVDEHYAATIELLNALGKYPPVYSYHQGDPSEGVWNVKRGDGILHYLVLPDGCVCPSTFAAIPEPYRELVRLAAAALRHSYPTRGYLRKSPCGYFVDDVTRFYFDLGRYFNIKLGIENPITFLKATYRYQQGPIYKGTEPDYDDGIDFVAELIEEAAEPFSPREARLRFAQFAIDWKLTVPEDFNIDTDQRSEPPRIETTLSQHERNNLRQSNPNNEVIDLTSDCEIIDLTSDNESITVD